MKKRGKIHEKPRKNHEKMQKILKNEKKIVKMKKNCEKWEKIVKKQKNYEKPIRVCAISNWFLGNVFQDLSISVKNIFGKCPFSEMHSRL